MKLGDIVASRCWVRAWCGGGRKKMSAWWECSLSSDQGVRTSLDRGSWEVPASRIFRQRRKNHSRAGFAKCPAAHGAPPAKRTVDHSQCMRSASLALAQTETGRRVEDGWRGMGQFFFSSGGIKREKSNLVDCRLTKSSNTNMIAPFPPARLAGSYEKKCQGNFTSIPFPPRRPSLGSEWAPSPSHPRHPPGTLGRARTVTRLLACGRIPTS